MKVFVSSVITGLEQFRDAAVAGARSLGHEVKRAEDFPAAPDTPQAACLTGIRWADVAVLLLGERYGARQASGLSATHEEYREARDRCSILAFEQQGVQRDPDQDRFYDEVRDWAGGVLTASFSSPDELRDAVTRALRDLELAAAVSPVDESEMLERAEALLPDRRAGYEASISVVIVGGPRQHVIRPADLEALDLEAAIAREALFGPNAVFDRSEGTRSRVAGDALIVEQGDRSILLDELGSVRVIQPARRPRVQAARAELPVLIEEDVRDAVTRGVRFGGWLLDRVDPPRRLSDVVVAAAIDRAGLGWRTRAEHDRDPNTITNMFSDERTVAQLAPPRRRRAALTLNADDIAEDLTVRIRRALRR